MPTDVRVFDAPSALAEAAADLTLELAEAAVRERGRFVWGLAGGSTPRALYETLAKPPYADAMPWHATRVFWGDERCVPADHPDSNQRMAREALLDAVAPAGVVPIPTENATPAESAAAAERGLRRLFNSANADSLRPRQEARRRAEGLLNGANADPPRPRQEARRRAEGLLDNDNADPLRPRQEARRRAGGLSDDDNADPLRPRQEARRRAGGLLNSDNADPLRPRQEARRRAEGLSDSDNADPPRPDLILLGIGSDGHTASLFPGTDALRKTERLFAANWIPQLGAWRVTATLRLINAARRIVFLAQGQDKADAVREALHPPIGAPPVPAALAAPQDGTVTWLLDREAAAKANRAPSP